MRVLHPVWRGRAESDDAVFALKGYGDPTRHIACDQSRQSDSEIDQRAVAKFERNPTSDQLLGIHQRGLSMR